MRFTGPIAVKSLLGLFVFSASVALAAVERLTLEQLTQQAHTIAIGKVIAQTSRWDYEENIIVTDVFIRVEEFLKRRSADFYVSFTLPGGVVGDLGLIVSNVPIFTADESVVLFLRRSSTTEFQLVNRRQGKASIQNGFVLREGESPVHLRDFVRQVREAMGERGPLSGALTDLINQYTSAMTVSPPIINNITPVAGPAHLDNMASSGCATDSTRITIEGRNFGTSQGTSTVRFWYQSGAYNSGCVESWSDTRIVARVPGRVSSGNVTVVVGGVSSNGVPFMVTYSYGGGKWTAPPLFFINPTNNDGLAISSIESAVLAAASTWNDVSGINLQFRFAYGGISTKTVAGYDGENSVLWVNRDTGFVAATQTWYLVSKPTEIIEIDVVLNDFSYIWGVDGSSEKMDIQNVMTHEFGHWLKLLDLYGDADSEKTMYGYTRLGEIKKRTLEHEDSAGILYIYPPTSPITFAQIVLGGAYETMLFVVNKTDTPWQGSIRIRRGNNQPWIGNWSINGQDFTNHNNIHLDLGPRQSAKLVFRGDDIVRAGYMEVFGHGSSSTSGVTLACFYNYYTGGKLANSTGVPPSRVGNRFVFPVEVSRTVDTGYALAPGPNFSPSKIRLRLFNNLGDEIANRLLDYEGHFAEFISQRFNNLPANFVGHVLIESPVSVALMVARMDFGTGWFLITNMPSSNDVP